MMAEPPDPAREAAASLADRFQRFPKIGNTIDPRDPALDPRYGLPPPPPETAPAPLRRLWDRIFGEPLSLLEFVPPGPLFAGSPLRILQREPPKLGTPEVSNIGHSEDSGNWAGAFATANGGKHLRTMLGLWQVPLNVTPTPGTNPENASCSVWIGLDGQRRYFDSSLPQIGTLTRFGSNGREDLAWVQWWERGSPNNNFLPLALPVAPGNSIGAFLHVIDPLNVWFVIVNLTAGRLAQAFKASAPVNGARPVVFGATAEWIVERPSHVSLKTMFDLPDFGQCRLEGLALQTLEPGAKLWEGDLRDMTAARLLRMLELRTDPSRTAIIAMPHRAGPQAVDVTYGGF